MYTAIKALEYLNDHNLDKLKEYLSRWAMEDVAKESGGSTMKKRAAAVRRCMSEYRKNRPNNAGAGIADDGKQIICNGYILVVFDPDESIQGCDQADAPVIKDYQRMMIPSWEQGNSYNITEQDLKTIRVKWTIDGKPKAKNASYAYPIINIGECYYNTDFLRDIIELIGVKDIVIRQSLNRPHCSISTIYKNEKQYGIIIPLRVNEDDKYYSVDE